MVLRSLQLPLIMIDKHLCPLPPLHVAWVCSFDAYSLADLKQLVMEHRCPSDTHSDCPDYNNFSRFLNYAPPKQALIAKVIPPGWTGASWHPCNAWPPASALHGDSLSRVQRTACAARGTRLVGF